MTNEYGPGKIDSRIPVPDQIRWSLDYIMANYDETNLRKHREDLRDKIKQWIIDNCEQDENGNYLYEFDKPVQLDELEVYGLMAQRRVAEFINEDMAWEVVEKYGLRDQVVEIVETEELNFDKLYALNQQGIIPDEDIDLILEHKESYALVRMEG